MLIISEFIQIFVNRIKSFFNSFGLMADDFQQRLCYELRSDHRVEECITVYRDCEKNVGILVPSRELGLSVITIMEAPASRAISAVTLS